MTRVVPLVALLLAAVSGCGKSIGDDCHTNVDCSPTGDRFCDTSAPNGYCTVEGCGDGTCPDEAVCIRFLTPVLSRPCTFDPAQSNSRSDCPDADERCVCSSVDAANCVGHCAPESSERRWCQLKCSSNDDCRSGYECRSTGTLGALPVPTLTHLNGNPARFCAPKGG
jgi:hypothetical protein